MCPGIQPFYPEANHCHHDHSTGTGRQMEIIAARTSLGEHGILQSVEGWFTLAHPACANWANPLPVRHRVRFWLSATKSPDQVTLIPS